MFRTSIRSWYSKRTDEVFCREQTGSMANAHTSGREVTNENEKKNQLSKGEKRIFFYSSIFHLLWPFSLYPILYTLSLSFVEWDGFTQKVPVGLANYQRLLADEVFWRSIGTTLLIALISTSLQMTFGLLLAFLLNQRWIRGSEIFKTVYYFPNLVTAVSLGVLFSLLFDWQSGGANKILLALKILEEPYNWKGSAFWSRVIVILIIFWQYFGYYTIIFTAGIKGISSELLEAASIDGASGGKIFFKIVLPLLRPIIVFACVTSIIGGLQIFDIPYTFGGVEGNPGKALFTMSMFMFRTTFKNNNFGYGAAISQ